MPFPINIAAALLALVVLAVVMQDVFEVMLLPRRVQRRVRLVRVYYRSSWHVWRRFAPEGERGGRLLSYFGASSMLLLFAIWATCLVCGFGLLHWSVQGNVPGQARSSLANQLYMSGTTFFTLGYGDVVPHSALSRIIAVGESGFGIAFIAIVISYLPVIHQFFSRRETHVMQLDARAGSPPTAATLVLRHADPADLPALDGYLKDWELWSAELLESHLAYPMLAYYRSEYENQSWLGAVGCVLDTCALVLVGLNDLRPLQARLTFSMARQVLVEMAQSFGVRPSADGPDRLDAAAYERLERKLTGAGIAWEQGDATRDALTALRATYEPLLDSLCRHLRTQVPCWMPADTAVSNWETGHRGLIAGRLVAELAARHNPAEPVDGDRLSRRLLRRFRS